MTLDEYIDWDWLRRHGHDLPQDVEDALTPWDAWFSSIRDFNYKEATNYQLAQLELAQDPSIRRKLLARKRKIEQEINIHKQIWLTFAKYGLRHQAKAFEAVYRYADDRNVITNEYLDWLLAGPPKPKPIDPNRPMTDLSALKALPLQVAFPEAFAGINTRPGKAIPCPFCPPETSRRPSMKLYDAETENQHVKCFRCGRGGSNIDVAIHLQGCNVKTAIEYLKTRLQA